MERPTSNDIIARLQSTIALMVRGQIEEQLAQNPARAQSWAGGLDRLEKWVQEEGLSPQMVREERSLLNKSWGEWNADEMTAIAWRIEGAAVLLYALGKLALPHDSLQPVASHEVQSCTSLLPPHAELLDGIRPLPPADIEHFRKAMGIWRWRARTELQHRRGADAATGEPYEKLVGRAAARAEKAGFITAVEGDFGLHGLPFAKLSENNLRTQATVALERGRAADWLCGQAGWDAPAEL